MKALDALGGDFLNFIEIFFLMVSYWPSTSALFTVLFGGDIVFDLRARVFLEKGRFGLFSDLYVMGVGIRFDL